MQDSSAQIQAHFSGFLDTFHLDASFTAPAQGVTALFGPSGCGKTTVLRCVAGLNRLHAGSLKIGDAVWQDERTFVPTHQRPIGYIFQEASLFPHLSIEANLTYGLKRSQTPDKIPMFDSVVSLLNLERLFDRPPTALSGGERQRVAMGRALLSGPELLLMDEPLSALDQFSKDEILPYLESLRKELSIPVLYVSHDIHEIERIADHMVIMEDGQVTTSGPLADILVDDQLPITRRPDAAVIFEGVVKDYDKADHLTSLTIDGGEILMPGKVGKIGGEHRLRVFANDISLAASRPSATTILNVFEAKVLKITPVGEAQYNVLCQLSNGGGGVKIPARITKRSFNTFQFKEGQSVFVQMKSVSLVDCPC